MQIQRHILLPGIFHFLFFVCFFVLPGLAEHARKLIMCIHLNPRPFIKGIFRIVVYYITFLLIIPPNAGKFSNFFLEI